MNKNNSITKASNNFKSNTIEARLQKLEQILQQILHLMGADIQDNTLNNNNKIDLQNIISILPNAQKWQGSNHQMSINPATNSGNIQNSSSRQISMSQGQIIAELAEAIIRANQRNK